MTIVDIPGGRCFVLGEVIEDTATRSCRQHPGAGRLLSTNHPQSTSPCCVPDGPRPVTRQRRREELAMTVTLVVVGLILAQRLVARRLAD
jgi:hypothetical protein